MPKRRPVILAGICLVYLSFAIGNAFTLMPWCDEAWFSGPAWSLLHRGYMGTPVLDPTATWRNVNLTGIDRHTYWIMPLYVVAQTAWYRLAGFSLFAMRAFSILWGLVALLSWYVILTRLARNGRVALLALTFLAFDFHFLWSASIGRMDMMTAALETAALAVYLAYRERAFSRAVVAANALAAAGVFTHPLGIVGAAGLNLAILYFDWRRVRLRHLALATLPYACGIAVWGLYIVRDPAEFAAQMGGNASDRWLFLSAPLKSLRKEVVERYLYPFGMSPASSGASRLKIVVLAIYALGVVGAFATRKVRSQPSYRLLLGLTVLAFFGVTVLDGFKQLYYLLYTVPLFAVLLAVWISHVWDDGGRLRWVAAAVVVPLIAIDTATTVVRIRQNRYQSDFLGSAEFLKRHARPGDLIIGSAELAFQFGFDGRVVDDYRLGYRSGRRPAWIVLDQNRYIEWIGYLEQTEPETHRYITDMLEIGRAHV